MQNYCGVNIVSLCKEKKKKKRQLLFPQQTLNTAI